MLSQSNAAICFLPPTAMRSGEQNRGNVILEMMLETFEAAQRGRDGAQAPAAFGGGISRPRIARRDARMKCAFEATNAFSLR
jgi:hypothetical protein